MSFFTSDSVANAMKFTDRRYRSGEYIAGVLLPLTEESLTFDRLRTVLSSGKAIEQLQSLIGKGYLQNLRIDSENRTVGLYMPEGALVQWVCASCGAKNRERRGGALRCKYCDQPRGQ